MALSPPLRVLVVDDEDSFRMSLEIGLRMFKSYEIESCDSGEKAVELLRKDSYDVVFMDYKMVEMTGLDVLRWMNEKNIDTPVVMLTGAGSEEIAVNAMKLGAYDYIMKEQLSVDRLPLTVNSVHERHLYRKELFRRQLEDRKDQHRQKELAALQMFQNTVNSVGQFVNGGLSNLSKKIQDREGDVLGFVRSEGRERVVEMLEDLRHELEVISAGVKSMLELSTLVGEKLEGIQNPDKAGEEAASKSG